MRKHLALALAVVAAVQSAHAADETGTLYVTPQAGYMWLDSDRNAQDAAYWGLGLGSHLSPEWSVELNAGGRNFDSDLGGDLEIRAFSLDALRVFNRAAAVSPFVSVGVGMISDDLEPGPDEKSPLAQIGAGLLLDVASNADDSFVLQLRPEVKARWDFIDTDDASSFLDYYAGLGFQFAWGEPKKSAPAPVAPTPAAAPTPPPPPPPPPPPADSDGDGVLDPQDQCPGTPRGVAVDAVGCPRKDTVTLQGVGFETNSATLTGDSAPVLNDVAADLKKYPRLKIEVQGHTDSRGTDAYNLKLSQRRAEAVREYLVKQGVSESQLTARGYGETSPTATNDTDEGRAQNRRVDLKVVDNPGDVEVKTEETTPKVD